MILVTGGAGFIGSHVCKLLAKSGCEFLILDNLERGHKTAIQGHQFVQADLRNRSEVAAVFDTHSIESVMHFAAYIEVGESTEQPDRFYDNNVIGTWNLLEAMGKHGVQQLVFSSTAAVYGEPKSEIIDEDHPKSPTSPYGETKWAVEQMARSYEGPHGLRSASLRYFNACGADPEGVLGEDHRPETHLIPRILKSLQGQGGIKIFGSDYATHDGTCIRDYVHVQDLAQAHILALDYLRSGGTSNAFNLGSQSGHSVMEVVQACEKVTGKRIQPEISDRRPGDPARLVASSKKAKEILGWNPVYTDIHESIEHAWNWFNAHPNGYGDLGQ